MKILGWLDIDIEDINIYILNIDIQSSEHLHCEIAELLNANC
jgi:hypothetical protein